MQAQVKTKILNSEWLLSGKRNFADFSKELEGCSSKRIYDNEMMRVLVDANWDEN